MRKPTKNKEKIMASSWWPAFFKIKNEYSPGHQLFFNYKKFIIGIITHIFLYFLKMMPMLSRNFYFFIIIIGGSTINFLKKKEMMSAHFLFLKTLVLALILISGRYFSFLFCLPEINLFFPILPHGMGILLFKKRNICCAHANNHLSFLLLRLIFTIKN